MSDNISAIDKAIQAAQARKAAKSGDTNVTSEASATPKAPKAPKTPKAPSEPKRPRLSDEEKTARTAARDAERATNKATRDVARAAKQAAKQADRKAPHMSKVEKAASKLPTLSEQAQLTVNDITANFSASVVSAIAAHLGHFNRVKATERALGQTIATGDTVKIVSGDSRFVGQTGEVFKAQRIRCYVTVAGAKKPVYLFTSDVELVSAAAVAKSA